LFSGVHAYFSPFYFFSLFPVFKRSFRLLKGVKKPNPKTRKRKEKNKKNHSKKQTDCKRLKMQNEDLKNLFLKLIFKNLPA